MGLDGFYLLTDDEEQALGLPTGKYDIAMSLCSKQYNKQGALVYNTNGHTGLWGDIIQMYYTAPAQSVEFKANLLTEMANRGPIWRWNHESIASVCSMVLLVEVCMINQSIF